MDPPLCANGCGFFGAPANKNLCSKCYRNFLEEEKSAQAKAKSMDKDAGLIGDHMITISISKLSLSSENTIDGESSKKKKIARCEKCKKKAGILGFKCRCGKLFCTIHRLPEKHECDFDYKTIGREILMKQNPLIKCDKLEKMK